MFKVSFEPKLSKAVAAQSTSQMPPIESCSTPWHTEEGSRLHAWATVGNCRQMVHLGCFKAQDCIKSFLLCTFREIRKFSTISTQFYIHISFYILFLSYWTISSYLYDTAYLILWSRRVTRVGKRRCLYLQSTLRGVAEVCAHWRTWRCQFDSETPGPIVPWQMLKLRHYGREA